MDIKCTEKELFLLKKIAHAAQALSMPCYVIGGFVRDKILDRPTKDADIVCVGDGIKLAKETAKRFHPVPHVSYFKNFGTAHIKVVLSDHKDSAKVSSPIGGGDQSACKADLEGAFDIEFVGARKESYRYHSRNPDVVPGTLEDDQNRRDFTINALAISLNEDDYGKLVDPFDGKKDIKKRDRKSVV